MGLDYQTHLCNIQYLILISFYPVYWIPSDFLIMVDLYTTFVNKYLLSIEKCILISLKFLTYLSL